MRTVLPILLLTAWPAAALAQGRTESDTLQPYEAWIEGNGKAGRPSVLVFNSDLGAC